MKGAAIDRFMGHVIPEPNSGCWLWTGTVNEQGYGLISSQGRTMGAHRYSYLLHRGEIRKGLHVCHQCDITCCVNPDHLWLGTNKENMADAVRKKRLPHQNVTACPKGHEYTAENTISKPRKGKIERCCRTCDIIRKRAKRAALKAAMNPTPPAGGADDAE